MIFQVLYAQTLSLSSNLNSYFKIAHKYYFSNYEVIFSLKNRNLITQPHFLDWCRWYGKCRIIELKLIIFGISSLPPMYIRINHYFSKVFTKNLTFFFLSVLFSPIFSCQHTTIVIFGILRSKKLFRA